MSLSITLELRRKFFHFSAAIIPIGYYLTDYATALWCIGALLGIAIVTEYLRLYIPSFSAFFNRFFGSMLRDGETDHYSGATFLLIASFLVIFAFHKDVAVLCLLFLIFGDGMAALIGKTIGRTRLLGLEKTLEGALACFAVCLGISFFFGHLPLSVRIAGAFTATVAEIMPMRTSDNLRIPIISGSIMQLMVIQIQQKQPIYLEEKEFVLSFINYFNLYGNA
ncbi:hypothetical protein L6Q79_10740 [bacterium]|nr:hypothetical protein [bacterium]NUN46005.1 hypothetical protein [bacterium]